MNYQNNQSAYYQPHVAVNMNGAPSAQGMNGAPMAQGMSGALMAQGMSGAPMAQGMNNASMAAGMTNASMRPGVNAPMGSNMGRVPVTPSTQPPRPQQPQGFWEVMFHYAAWIIMSILSMLVQLFSWCCLLYLCGGNQPQQNAANPNAANPNAAMAMKSNPGMAVNNPHYPNQMFQGPNGQQVAPHLQVQQQQQQQQALMSSAAGYSQMNMGPTAPQMTSQLTLQQTPMSPAAGYAPGYSQMNMNPTTPQMTSQISQSQPVMSTPMGYSAGYAVPTSPIVQSHPQSPKSFSTTSGSASPVTYPAFPAHAASQQSGLQSGLQGDKYLV